MSYLQFEWPSVGLVLTKIIPSRAGKESALGNTDLDTASETWEKRVTSCMELAEIFVIPPMFVYDA
mgnify:CR=1 FL=1